MPDDEVLEVVDLENTRCSSGRCQERVTVFGVLLMPGQVRFNGFCQEHADGIRGKIPHASNVYWLALPATCQVGKPPCGAVTTHCEIIGANYDAGADDPIVFAVLLACGRHADSFSDRARRDMARRARQRNEPPVRRSSSA